MTKNFKHRGIHTKETYTVEEAAGVVGSCARTIRNWVWSGDLPVVSQNRPILILGADLKAAVIIKKKPRTRLQDLTDFFCMTCKEARPGRDGTISCEASEGSPSVAYARCSICDGRCSRRLSASQLDELRRVLSRNTSNTPAP